MNQMQSEENRALYQQNMPKTIELSSISKIQSKNITISNQLNQNDEDNDQKEEQSSHHTAKESRSIYRNKSEKRESKLSIKKNNNSHSRSYFLNKNNKTDNVSHKTQIAAKQPTQNNNYDLQNPYIDKLTQQNAKLQSRNKKLWQQLKDLSSKVDQELHKKSSNPSMSKNRKARVLSTQQISNMQLQNAYKKCDIYKKQIQTLKNKDKLFNEQQINILQGKLKQQQKKNQGLSEEVKALKKDNIKYQKIVSEMRDDDYIKLRDENLMLKKQNLGLKKKLQKQERQIRITELQKSNEKKKAKNHSLQLQKSRKKAQEIQVKNQSLLKNKVQNNNKQIRFLSYENNRQKDIINELKQQIKELNQQVDKHKQIIRRLRYLQGQKKKKVKTSSKVQNSISQNSQNFEKSFQQDLPHTIQQHNQKIISKYPCTLEAHQNVQDPTAYKWNHHSYASKVKQVQVMMNSDGYVKALNFRYEKGEPPKTVKQGKYAVFVCTQSSEYVKELRGGFFNGILAYIKLKTNKNRQASFCRHELQNDQQNQKTQNFEIQEKDINLNSNIDQNKQSALDELPEESQDEKQKDKIKKQNYLLSLPNNRKNNSLPPLLKKCLKFAFANEQNEYVMSFYGENTSQGIIKLGCLIGAENKATFS